MSAQMPHVEEYGFPEDLMMAPAPADLSFMNLIKQEINSPGSDPELNTGVFRAAGQHQPPDHMDFEAGPAAAAPVQPRKGKKRPATTEADSAAGNEEAEKKKNNGVVGLTELIDKIASEKSALRFDDETKLYEVVDGPAFEARFQELRRTRSKRSNETAARPFSRMHVHYTIVRGERWAGTGTAFRAKDAVVDDFLDTEKVQASKINVTLMPSDGLAGFQVSLQHFLNVTGAGDAYKRAMRAKDGDNTSPSTDDGTDAQEAPEVLRESSDDYWHSLSIDTVSEAVNSVWSENSKGDQAYFFYREQRDSKFPNGSVVKLVDGKLTSDDTPSDRAVYMVVSDDNAKWKGEPIPSAEQEKLGHWCCFLGQVPVRCKGVVKSGQYVGPAGDGSGCCESATPGLSAVVGIALVGKEGEGEGIVRTMCFAGLNAMNAGMAEDNLTSALADGLATKAEVAALKLDLRKTKQAVFDGIDTLNERVDTIERQLEVSYAGYAVAGAGIPMTPRMVSPRVVGEWQSPRAEKATRWKKPGTTTVSGQEVELRLMGCKVDGDEAAGVPLCVDLEAKGELYRAQCVSPKAGCGAVDNQGKTRAFIVTALCVLFLGVVAASFFIGWSTATVGPSDPVSTPAAEATAQEDAAEPKAGGCTVAATEGECGSIGGCRWAVVTDGVRAGQFVCIDDIASDVPNVGGVDDAEEDDAEEEVVAEEEEEEPRGFEASCDAVATAEACDVADGCEWTELGSAPGCVDSATADRLLCESKATEAECDEGMVMCTWEKGACGLGSTDMVVAECGELEEEDECEGVSGCEWRTEEGVAACFEEPMCSGKDSAEDCGKEDGCLWLSYGEKGSSCVVDPNRSADPADP